MLKGNVLISPGIRFNDEPGQNVEINNCEIYYRVEQNYFKYRALDQTCVPDSQAPPVIMPGGSPGMSHRHFFLQTLILYAVW